MSYDYYVGIDYGTSTCKLAYAVPPLRRGGDPVVKNLSFVRRGTDSSPRFPSAVAFTGRAFNGRRKVVTGFEAEKIFEDARRLNEVDPVLSPKMDIGEGIVYPFAPPEHSEPSDLCYLTIEPMIREFEKKLNTSRSRCKFLVTVPASFSSQHREELMEAIKRLNIDCNGESLVDEPNAAFLGMIGYPALYPLLRRLRNGRLLVVDFGAGTCDLSLLHVKDDPTNEPYGVSLTNLGISDYARLGGNDIDRAIADSVLSHTGVAHEKTSFYAKFLTIASFCSRKTKELYLRNGRIGSARKSKDDVVDLPMVITETTRTRAEKVPYPPDKLAEVVDSLLGRGGRRRVTLASLIANVLGKAGMNGGQPDAILLAGGSSGLFESKYFRSFFFETFPTMKEESIVSTDEADLLVSRGAALECLFRFGLKKPILRAICPSDVGIRTAEGEHRVLIKAGTPLPYPNQEDIRFMEELYVPSPKPETMRIPIAVRRFGRWINVETWEVDLPDEFLPGEPVQFSCGMSHEKVLTVEFRSDRCPGLRFEYTCQHWLHGKEQTPAEQMVKTMRQNMKETAQNGGVNPPPAYIRLASAEYHAGMHVTARRRCEFLIQHMTDKFSKEQLAQLWNLHGLSCDYSQKGSSALLSYRKACDNDPCEAVYQYNAGVTYLWNKQDPSNALHYLQRARDLDRNDPKIAYWYGRTQERLGKEWESKIALNQAWDLLTSRFGEGSGNTLATIYRDLCDMKGVPYPEVLNRALNRGEAINEMNIQPGLIDRNDIVRATQKGAEHEAEAA